MYSRLNRGDYVVKGEFNGTYQSNTLVLCKTPQKRQSGMKRWEFYKSEGTEVLVFEKMQPFIPITSAVIQENLKVKHANQSARCGTAKMYLYLLGFGWPVLN